MIAIGHVWMRLFGKCTLLVAGPDATAAAGTDQLCAGLKVGIEGAIHAANTTWQHLLDSNVEDWAFLQLDATMAFQTQDRCAMLYHLRYEWPKGAMFVFNCYKHFGFLILRSNNGTAVVIYAKTGVAQGDPLSMFCYGLGLLTLISRLKAMFPTLFHSWYADDGSAAGQLHELKHFLLEVKRAGPAYGYNIDPSECIIITQASSLDTAHRIFSKHGIQRDNIVTGHRHLGGFLGDNQSKELYVQKKIDLWVASIQKLSCATRRFPQEGLCALTKSLQMEWTFLQRVIPCYSSFFQPLEDAITSHFLPALFHTEIVPPRELTRLPRKNAGLGIPDPTEQKDQSFSTSSKASRLLMKSLVNHSAPFCLKDHNDHVKEVRSSHQAHKAEIAKLSLDFFLANNPSCKRITEAASQSGLWISIPPTLDTKTTLSPIECRDNLFLRYNMTPPNLNSRCDGCHQPFSVNHGLNCPKGGLITIHRHDELRNELGDLLMNAFGRSAV